MADSDSRPYGVIYLVTNKVTGKIYVGQTISDIKARWKGHCNAGKSSRLWHSIQKHGRESFTVEQIDSAETKEQLDDLERSYIALYDATNKDVGYNFERGGSGAPRTKDVAARVAEKLRGRKVPLESVQKMAATKKGRPRTEAEQAVLDRMAEINRGRKHTEESIRRMSEAVTGIKMAPATPEHRKKLSDAAKKQWQSGRGHGSKRHQQ